MIRNRNVIISVLIFMMATLLFSTAYASGDDPFKGMRTYYEGQYKVGRDFIAGEYDDDLRGGCRYEKGDLPHRDALCYGVCG